MKVIYNLFARICLFVCVQKVKQPFASAHPSILQGKISRAEYPASLSRYRSVSRSRLFCHQFDAVIRPWRTYRKLSQKTQHSTQHIRDTHHYLHYAFICISSIFTFQSNLNLSIAKLTSRRPPDYTYIAHKMPHSHLPSPSASLVVHSLSTKSPAAGKLQPHYQSRIPHACRSCRCRGTYAHQRSNP